jgi:hypothetical protein
LSSFYYSARNTGQFEIIHQIKMKRIIGKVQAEVQMALYSKQQYNCHVAISVKNVFTIMRYCLLIFINILFLSSCHKQEPNNLFLTISRAEWYSDTISIDNIWFREIRLKISGNSNAGLLSLMTSGDGLIGCTEMKLNSNNYFSADVQIRFFPTYTTIRQKASTILTAYSSREKPNQASVCEFVGSGDTICKSFVSPYYSSK